MRALVFDTETTGLIGNRTVHIDKQPYCIEFYGELVNLAEGGKVEKFFHTLIKPPILLPTKVKGDKGIADITGITDEMLSTAPRFADVAQQIKALIEESPGVIAHNLSFDMDMVEIEMERAKVSVKWPKRRICTVEQTIHMRGHRLNLTKLHNILFPGESFTPHRANEDVKALTRCATELHRREII